MKNSVKARKKAENFLKNQDEIKEKTNYAGLGGEKNSFYNRKIKQ